jgi:hypothetical protein
MFAGLVFGAFVGMVVGLANYVKLRAAPLETAQPLTPARNRFWRRMAMAAFLVAVIIMLAIISVALYRLVPPGFFRSQRPVEHFPFEPPAATGSDQNTTSPGAAPSPVALEIKPAPFDVVHPEPHSFYWGFNGFIPPSSLASFVFVVWSNGVPTVDPGFSTYFKVGPNGGIDLPFCLLDCYRPVDTALFTGVTETQRSNVLAAWHYPESAGISNAVRWDVNLGAGSTGSRWLTMPPYHKVEGMLLRSVRTEYQAVIPLIEFDQAPQILSSRESGTEVRVRVQDPLIGLHGLLAGKHGQSGVELRIFLEPLTSPTIRSLPGETDHTNYVVGTGLAWPIEKVLDQIKHRQFSE